LQRSSLHHWQEKQSRQLCFFPEALCSSGTNTSILQPLMRTKDITPRWIFIQYIPWRPEINE
jgi:hypothetical protein